AAPERRRHWWSGRPIAADPKLPDAGWSSPVARWAHNPKVAGSNPAPATKRSRGYGSVRDPFFVQRARKPARRRRNFRGGVPQIGWAHDVVAVEDRARFVAGDRHRDPLRHPRVDHISDGGPPEVVAELAGQASLRAGRNPSSAEVEDALALVGA